MNWLERWLNAVFGRARAPREPTRPHVWGFVSMTSPAKVWHRRRGWANVRHPRGTAGVFVKVWRWVWVDASRYDGPTVRRLQGQNGVRPSLADRMARRAA